MKYQQQRSARSTLALRALLVCLAAALLLPATDVSAKGRRAASLSQDLQDRIQAGSTDSTCVIVPGTQAQVDRMATRLELSTTSMAALSQTGAVLMPEHLSSDIAASRRTLPASERVLDPTEVVVRIDQPVPAAVQRLERTMIQYALCASCGRMEESAAMLGLSRKGLYLKRLRYGLEPPEAAADVA